LTLHIIIVGTCGPLKHKALTRAESNSAFYASLKCVLSYPEQKDGHESNLCSTDTLYFGEQLTGKGNMSNSSCCVYATM